MQRGLTNVIHLLLPFPFKTNNKICIYTKRLFITLYIRYGILFTIMIDPSSYCQVSIKEFPMDYYIYILFFIILYYNINIFL